MKRASTPIVPVALLAVLGLFPSVALGQMGMGSGRSLGGYGSATIGPYYAGSGQIPAGGRIGVIPSSGRMASTPIGGASAMTFRASSGAMTGARRPLGGGMGPGMGLGGSVGMPMTRAGGMRRGSPGPGLGWPFTVPPDLSGSRPMGMP